MERVDWVRGDAFGLEIPADAAALLAGGTLFLTRACRAAGTLPDGVTVAAIERAVPVEAGGSGSKLLLRVAYAPADPALPTELFVKFSRNFADPARDAPRMGMAPEVRLALLSRDAGFPVAVPECRFADFHHASGTGLLITACIPFGADGVEPHHPKCMDWRLPDPLDHYRALIRATARLAGTHKAGRLPARVAAEFPFSPQAALAADRNPYTPERMRNRVSRLAAFAAAYPQLLPDTVRAPAFLAAFADDAALFLAHEAAIKRWLHAEPEFIALCHWNANIDNAWFWRDAAGALECGLLDWGGVGQMHVAMTIWGCLSGAEPELWADHLGELLDLFVAEFAGAGGPRLDRGLLSRHLDFYVAMMGLAYLMDAPPRIERAVPHLAAVSGPRDPRLVASETGRVQLLMMTNFLLLWRRHDVGAALRRLVAA